MDWSRILSLAGETIAKDVKQAGAAAESAVVAATTVATSVVDGGGGGGGVGVDAILSDTQSSFSFVEDYATFAKIYLNTFYCLAIVCMVSVFDR